MFFTWNLFAYYKLQTSVPQYLQWAYELIVGYVLEDDFEKLYELFDSFEGELMDGVELVDAVDVYPCLWGVYCVL